MNFVNVRNLVIGADIWQGASESLFWWDALTYQNKEIQMQGKISMDLTFCNSEEKFVNVRSFVMEREIWPSGCQAYGSAPAGRDFAGAKEVMCRPFRAPCLFILIT